MERQKEKKLQLPSASVLATMATHLSLPTSTSNLSRTSLFSASPRPRFSPFLHCRSATHSASSSRLPYLSSNAALRRETERFSDESDYEEEEEEEEEDIDLEWMERDAKDAVREYTRSLSRELTIGIPFSSPRLLSFSLLILSVLYPYVVCFLESRLDFSCSPLIYYLWCILHVLVR